MCKNNGLERMKTIDLKLCTDGKEYDIKGFTNRNREDIEKIIEYNPDTIYREPNESDKEFRERIKK